MQAKVIELTRMFNVNNDSIVDSIIAAALAAPAALSALMAVARGVLAEGQHEMVNAFTVYGREMQCRH